MKRAYFLLLLFFMFAPILHAQTQQSFPKSEISLGPEYAVLIGDFRDKNGASGPTDRGYNYGIGGSVKYLLHLNSTYGLSLQAGAIRYHSKESSLTGLNGASAFTSIPVKLGGNLRYKSLFAEPQFGFTYFTGKDIFYQSGSTTYGLVVGSYITDHIMLSGNIERWNKGGFAASHVGIRLAYTFSLKKLSLIDSIRKERAVPSYRVRPEYDKTSEYWAKHKTCKTFGWVSVGIGAPLTFLGLVTAIASAATGSVRPATYQWLLGSGAVLSTSSIPLFIFSHKYKKMARK